MLKTVRGLRIISTRHKLESGARTDLGAAPNKKATFDGWLFCGCRVGRTRYAPARCAF